MGYGLAKKTVSVEPGNFQGPPPTSSRMVYLDEQEINQVAGDLHGKATSSW